jgi:outer membrane protein assembly factor BamB
MPSLDRRTFLASTGAAGAALLAGCPGLAPAGPTAYRSYGYDAHNRGVPDSGAGPGESVEPAWRLEEATFPQTPAVVDGQVFVSTDRGQGSVVVGLDAESGDENWEYDAGAPVGRWSPALEDGTLYFVDIQGRAHAVATDDGSRKWRRDLPRELRPAGAPVVTDGALVFGLGALPLFQFGGLYALETADGSTRWHRGPDAAGGGSNTPAYPAAERGTVYYAALPAGGDEGRGSVVAVSAADGEPEWTARVGERAVYAGAAVTDDRLYLGGTQGGLALDREDRSVVWRSPRSYLFTPPTVGERAYVGRVGESGIGLRALDRDGEELWRHVLEGLAGSPGPATAADGVVYYGAGDGRLYALDAESGQRRWRYGEELTAFWTPAVVDGTVYVASGRGLVALR